MASTAPDPVEQVQVIESAANAEKDRVANLDENETKEKSPEDVKKDKKVEAGLGNYFVSAQDPFVS